MRETLLEAVRRHADARAGADGLVATPIQGVTMMRYGAPTGINRTIYRPVLCLVLQGAKRVVVGQEVHEFGAGQSLVVGVDLLAAGQVVRASEAEPYLALSLDLEMSVLREVASELGEERPEPPDPLGRDPTVLVEDTREAVADASRRLVQLLDRPQAIPVLRPAIVKEMYYWLLVGQHGAILRRLSRIDGHAERIARAVAILRSSFDQPIAVGQLAEAAGMSPSSFHQHFRAITSLSPLQFQKRLRLLEARRLMLEEGLAATVAAFRVGYESASQFTREYGRMFGVPPRRDMEARRIAA